MADRGALDAADAAVMGFAGKVAADAPSITQADIDALRAVGLSDDEILDVALSAALRCFFSTTLDAVGTLPDAEYRGLDEELRQALTVGRPIAQ
jgi:alkylhydroperoxidase family enzyme